MNTSLRTLISAFGIAVLFIPYATAKGDETVAAVTPLEIRALGEKLPKPGTSDARSIAEQCARILNQVEKLHDPDYDPDVELNLRRMELQEFRKTKKAATAYVSWQEVSKWTPTNNIQLAIASLSMKTAKAIHQTVFSTLDDECRIVDSMRVSSAIRRSVTADICSLHLKASWPGNMGGMEQICSKYKKLLASTSDANERLALSSRMIRRAAALKTDWRKYRDIPGMNPWIETSRRQIVHDCGVVSAETERCLVSWMRIAALVQNYGKLANETKDVLIDTNRVLDEQGKTIRAEKVPYYAVVFGTMQQLLALDFFNHGVLGMEGQPFEIIQPFAKESARMLGIEAGKDYEMFLRSVDGMVSLVKDNPDAIIAYLDREDIRNGVVKKPNKVETPDPGRFEPYPTSNELKQQLARYGFEAGTFVQAAFRQPGKTNRVSYVVYTPKNESGKVPVLLFLPGIGEIGNDLSKLFRQRTIFDKVTSADFQKKHPCYLVAISPPDGTKTLSGYDTDGGPTPIQRTIHDALFGIARTRKRPAVDENRIYVTGLSFGGTGAYALTFGYPGVFAASVPVSADVFPAKRLGEVLPCNYFHLYNEGEMKSRSEEVSMLEEFGARVRELGGDFRVGTFPNEGHNAWDAAWRDEAVWDWMFSKRRGANGTTSATLGRISNPTRRAGREEKHAESAENAAPKPPAVTASKPGRDGRTGPERALDGLDGTAYVSASPVAAGDWLQVEWSAPVQGRIEVRTGLSDGTLRLSKGRVEVSADGRMWSRVGTVSSKTGVCALQQRTGIRFLRLLPEPRLPEPLAVREIAVRP